MIDARLVNPHHGDPALFVRLGDHVRAPAGLAYLFDCGNLHNLSNSDILRVRRVFVSHTHIDHCIGLDHLIRLQLYSKSPLEIYGPPGLIEQFSGRLRGYVWNLTGDSHFAVELHELHSDRIHSRLLRCSNRFLPERRRIRHCTGSLLLPEGYCLRWIGLDHGVACLGYFLTGPQFFRFRSDRAAQMGIAPGPWISQLKEWTASNKLSRRLKVGAIIRSVAEWSADLLEREPSPTLAYITDTLLGEIQRLNLGPFLRGCQQLWCESTYRNADAAKATANLHATAGQAAMLAKESDVAKLFLFHLSRRYEGEASLHLEEARQIFPNSDLGPRLQD